MSQAPLTPDFFPHQWQPLSSAEIDNDFVKVQWPDGLTYDAYSLWLAENAEGYGLEPGSRESMLEPRHLPQPGDLTSCEVGTDGELIINWEDGRSNRIHPGWLRYTAEGRLSSQTSLPTFKAWDTSTRKEPPTARHDDLDDAGLTAWLADLISFGMARVTDAPKTDDFLDGFAQRIGVVRGSNFGNLFTVESMPQPDSTANTTLALGQHSDLPSRETPPGFQFLHCIINDSTGGDSLLSDGISLVETLRQEAPDAYASLIRDEWVFMNRAEDADHRWTGPSIELPAAGRPLTLRAFYPVRSVPNMPKDRIADAYEALRVFYEYTRDERFTIRFRLNPGDLIVFDNRRILHGRDAFSDDGVRRLRGCYMDQDDVYSTYRVLCREHG